MTPDYRVDEVPEQGIVGRIGDTIPMLGPRERGPVRAVTLLGWQEGDGYVEYVLRSEDGTEELTCLETLIAAKRAAAEEAVRKQPGWQPAVDETVEYPTEEDWALGTVCEIEPTRPQFRIRETGLWYELDELNPDPRLGDWLVGPV